MDTTALYDAVIAELDRQSVPYDRDDLWWFVRDTPTATVADVVARWKKAGADVQGWIDGPWPT